MKRMRTELTRLRAVLARMNQSQNPCRDSFHVSRGVQIDYRETMLHLAPVGVAVDIPLCPSCGLQRGLIQIRAIEPAYPA